MPPQAIEPFDLVVVGGGINGAGIARDAAGRGLRVLLCEQHDLASHTSSASSKLIHGGLRYLEYYQFRLVAKSLAEREVLLRNAPHVIRPLRFVMPHVPGLRPAWMIRLGLFLYDHLDFGRRQLLPGSRGVRLDEHPAGEALAGEYRRGFEYSDAWVDDARLVVLNAVDALERGALVLTRTACLRAERGRTHWTLTLGAAERGRRVQSRAVVNATGPWADEFLASAVGLNDARRLRRVKGSHIVVPRLSRHDYAYIFQNPDKRVVFALPFERHFTLIGTTDVEYEADPDAVAIDDDEMAYLCGAVNRFFRRRVGVEDIVHTFSGVRALVDDGQGEASAVTRDYVLRLDTRAAPLLSVLGGKLTTYRKLAEEAMQRLGPVLGGVSGDWTATAPLPGGDISDGRFDRFLESVRKSYPWLPDALAERLARAYGTRIEAVMDGARSLSDLGRMLGDSLSEREIDYLVSKEWARTADDILWRRSKLGMSISGDDREWLRERMVDELRSPATGFAS